MKFKLQAGMDIDLLTRQEVAAELGAAMQSWRAELARGFTYRRSAVQATPAGAGPWTIDGPADQLGPREGFVWAVTRVSVGGAPAWDQGVSTFDVYTNDRSPSQIVAAELLTPLLLDVGALVLNPGESLVFAGTAAAAGQIYVNIQAVEVSQPMAWRLV